MRPTDQGGAPRRWRRHSMGRNCAVLGRKYTAAIVSQVRGDCLATCYGCTSFCFCPSHSHTILVKDCLPAQFHCAAICAVMVHLNAPATPVASRSSEGAVLPRPVHCRVSFVLCAVFCARHASIAVYFALFCASPCPAAERWAGSARPVRGRQLCVDRF